MKKKHHILDQLPTEVPIYSAHENVLLPGSNLPFFVNTSAEHSMVEDAMRSDRYIGVIQEKTIKGSDSGELFSSGCLGYISSYSETDDGTFIILGSVCRFETCEELPSIDGYRRARVDYRRYRNDLRKEDMFEPQIEEPIDRPRLLKALKRYLTNNKINTNWEEVINASNEKLLSAIVTSGPFNAIEKQALLESVTLTERCCMLTALIEMASHDLNKAHH